MGNCSVGRALLKDTNISEEMSELTNMILDEGPLCSKDRYRLGFRIL